MPACLVPVFALYAHGTLGSSATISSCSALLPPYCLPISEEDAPHPCCASAVPACLPVIARNTCQPCLCTGGFHGSKTLSSGKGCAVLLLSADPSRPITPDMPPNSCVAVCSIPARDWFFLPQTLPGLLPAAVPWLCLSVPVFWEEWRMGGKFTAVWDLPCLPGQDLTCQACPYYNCTCCWVMGLLLEGPVGEKEPTARPMSGGTDRTGQRHHL